MFSEPRSAVILTPTQEELCAQGRWDFSDLGALFVTCMLKRSPEVSNSRMPATPTHGNQRSAWDVGCRFDSSNPEYC